MTRRNIIFKDKSSNQLYVSSEFNGDKEEFYLRGGQPKDGCSKKWADILKEFEGVSTLKEFELASEMAQKCYASFLGIDILPVEKIDYIDNVKNDEVYLLEDGVITKLP